MQWLKEMRMAKKKLNQNLIQDKVNEVLSTLEISAQSDDEDDKSGQWFKIWNQRCENNRLKFWMLAQFLRIQRSHFNLTSQESYNQPSFNQCLKFRRWMRKN